MSERNVRLKIDKQSMRDIEAYAEYRRVVGDDDGGKMFTPKEYENYKKKVLPMRMKNRLFVTFTNPDGMDCICVGPETECFCQHRFKQHTTDFQKLPETRPIDLPCQVRGCSCVAFHYASKNGGQPVRCHCKHMTPDHSPASPFICNYANCKCTGFKSSFTCDCGYADYKHRTAVETGPEREARGHPVGAPTIYKAMGGLTGFSSLAPGYARLDPSGIGAPSDEFLNQPITNDDHPFLRSHVSMINTYKQLESGGRPSMSGQETNFEMRQPHESELDFYERRYQSKLKSGHFQQLSNPPTGMPRISGQRKKKPDENPSSSKH